MSYKFFDNIAIADVAFEATGKTIEQMFESAGNALMVTQVKDLKTVKTKVEIKFELTGQNEERLLHNFLQELIFYKDSDLLLFSKYELKITKTADGLKLAAVCKGEQIDTAKHEMLVDVKAVSWHMFKIEFDKKEKKWKAFVILDV